MPPRPVARPRHPYRNDGRPAITLSSVQSHQRDVFLGRIERGEYHFESVPTCVCGGEEAVALSEKDRFGIPVGVVVCTRCGLVRTTPRLAAENLPAFYNDDYHALHQGIVEPTPDTALFRPGQGAAIFDLLRPYLPDRRLLVAEIGAATGRVLREFAEAARVDEREVDLVGCEYAASFVEVGRNAGMDMRVGGIEALEGIDPPDVLIMSHVLEHFPDPVSELRRVRALLKPESIVYVEVPGLRSIDTKPEYEYDLLQYLTLAHTFHFTRGTLVRTMRHGGFQLLVADEEVRSVFALRQSDDAVASYTYRSSDAPDTLAYLDWLATSKTMRTRRARQRLRSETRRRVKRIVQPVLGETGWSIARRLWHQVKRPRLTGRA